MESLTSTRATPEIHFLEKHVGNSEVTPILSYETRLIFEVVNCVTLCAVIGMFGIVSNSINILVFFKQGFNNTVNISFFGLAISDLFCLVTMEWVCICLNPFLVASDVAWMPVEVQYLTGAWPHVCFSRITSLITAYVAAERCLCIAIPLKVKQIITPRRTTAVVIVVYFVNIVTLVPEYATSYIGWNFYPSRNATLLGLAFTRNRKYVEGLVFVLNSILGVASFAAVIIFTVILIVKLQYSSTWRKQASLHHERQENVSNREKKTMKMVLMIAIILIVCYTPGTIISMTTYVVSEFQLMGAYVNIFSATWTIAFVFQAINSSVNIFLYYYMSSNYKAVFDELFFRRIDLQ